MFIPEHLTQGQLGVCVGVEGGPQSCGLFAVTVSRLSLSFLSLPAENKPIWMHAEEREDSKVSAFVNVHAGDVLVSTALC